MTSVRSNQPNSNLSCVEELLDAPPADGHKGPSVSALRSQLALEYRLQSLSQRLLESYKDQNDWAAVGQVAQSLVTNTQRVSVLKERLLSGDHSYLSPPHRLQSITELPSVGDFGATVDCQRSSLLVSEADDEAGEAIETGTESESDTASSLSTAQCLDSHGPGDIPRTATSEGSSGGSGASSAVDYETASQQTTSEGEPETGSTGLDTTSTNSGPDQQLSSTAPSPTHSSSGHSADSVETHTPQQTSGAVEEGSQLQLTQSAEQQEQQSAANSPCDTERQGEKKEHSTGEEAEGMESIMEDVRAEGTGSGGTAVVSNGNGEVCLSGTEVEKTTAGVEGGEGEGEGRVEQNGDLNSTEGDNCVCVFSGDEDETTCSSACKLR